MNSKKAISNFTLISRQFLGANNYLLKLYLPENVVFPTFLPGQFVQVQAFGQGILLRRPISVCNVIDSERELWLLVANVGRGTEVITSVPVGGTINIIYPLGNGFLWQGAQKPLLIGGGVGIAPLLYLSRALASQGIRPRVLLGGRTAEHIVLQDEFAPYADIFITTDDGSLGIHGRVTDHPIIKEESDLIFTCGPKPMMAAVAKVAELMGIPCQVSLENVMACGIGTCLCCVEDTRDEGNICVCTEGPVFNSERIKW